MKHKITIKLLWAVAFLSGQCLAQTCLSGAVETSPTGVFEAVESDELRDSRTQLIWQRCSVGQTRVEGSCTGEPLRMTWQQALQYAHQTASEQGKGWRLPNVKELATLTERQCVRPAINSSVFPDTPSDDFWTSTPSVDDPDRAWVVAFFNSSHSLKQKERFIYVRLVRQ